MIDVPTPQAPEIPAGHYLDTEHGRFWIVCHFPPDAPCRCGCEESCAAYENGDACDHPKTRPLGYCNLVEWVDADGVEDTYDPDAPTHLFPVSMSWNDGHVVWSLAEATR